MSRYVGRESCEKWCGALGPQLVSLELGSGALSSVFDRAHGWFGKWGRALVRVRDRAGGDQRTTRSNLGLENVNMANDEGRLVKSYAVARIASSSLLADMPTSL